MDTLIVYGNCQAQGIVAALNRHPAVTKRFEVAYQKNFGDPNDPSGSLTPDQAQRSAIVLEQYAHDASVPLPEIPKGTPRVTFPSADLNVLWPLWSVNPFNGPEPPRFPHGRFPYGDAVILRLVREGHDAEAALAYYLNNSGNDLPDLDRFLRLEQARLTHRDTQCDVKLGSIVLAQFREERLFWTINHPAHALIRVVVNAVFERAEALEPRLAGIRLDKAYFDAHFGAEMLGQIAVPVHPDIAERFALKWYDRNEQFAYYGETRTYEEYFRSLIEFCIAGQRASEIVS